MQKSKKKGQPVRLGRRVLALLLCVCMITTLVPISAHAETKETEQGQIRTYANETNVEKVTDGSGADKDVAVEKAEVTITAPDGTVTTTKYTDLIEAFDDADTSQATKIEVRLLQDGETYTLDSTEDFPIKFGHTNQVKVIVDLNGCTLKRSVTDDTYGILKVEKGNVTIKNGTLDLDDSESSINPAQAIETPSGYSPTLTLENMTIKVVDIDTAVGYRTAKGYAIRAEGGTLNIKSGAYGKVLINDYIATAKLYGGSYDLVECYNDYAGLLETGYIFATKDDGTYIDPGTMGVNSETREWENTKNIKVIECKHEGGYTDGKCNRCGYVCLHTSIGDGYKCSTCNTQMAAKVGETYFTTLAAAIEAAKNNGTVTLLADEVEGNITIADGTTVTIDLNGKTWKGEGTTWTGCKPVPLTVNGGSVTVKNGTLKQGGASDNANTAVIVNGGSLTVGEKMTIQGSKYDSSTVLPAITVESGSLTLTENTNLYGGMKVTVEGKLLKDYLPEGTAFAVGESIIDGYVQSHVKGDTLTVVEHSHTFAKKEADGGYYCECGYECPHRFGEDGKCADCGYVCPHENLSEADGVTTCSDCEAQMAVKVEYTEKNGDKQTKHYAQTFDSMNIENTLQTILNDDTITPSGSTITLLAKDLWAFAFVDDGKTVTLNLNGKNLIETGNGIAVDKYSKLIVTGEGTSTQPTYLTEDQYSYVFNVRGGTLEFRVFDFGGTFNGIRVGSGTLISYREKLDSIHIGTLHIDDADAKISFKAAAFDKIVFGGTSGSVKLGDLLGVWQDSEGNPVRSGNAFQKTDGTLLPYDTKITGENPVENVEIAACSHDSVTDRTCDYCGTKNLTAIVVDGGGAIATYATTDDSPEAEKTSVGYALNNGWNNNGNNRTLKLFVDVTLTADVSLNASKHLGTGAKQNTIRGLDLNGHNFTGTDGAAYGVSVNELVTLTIKDSSAGKGSFSAGVTVNDGGSLIVDGVHMGTITATDSTAKVTLKAGSSLEGYSLPEGMILADWIEDGCCIYDTGADGNARIPVVLTETGAKTAAGKFVVEKAAAEITAGTKTGELPYGSGVPGEFCPKVTLEDTAAQIKVVWYRRTDSSCEWIGSGTIKDGSYAVNLSTPDFDGVRIGDTLEVFCTISAVGNIDDRTPFWQTVLTGYELTVIKGNSCVITPPAAVKDMVYKAAEKDKKWSLVTAGKAEGGTMVYSLSKDGTYTETVPTAENVGSYTVWYKVLGDENHTDTEPESVTAQIAKAEITLTGLDLKPKIYDGTTKANIVSANFVNSNGQPISELDGKDYKVEAAFEDANVGDSKKVKATVTLCDTEKAGNYVLMNNEVEDVGSITKADAPDTAGGTLYIGNNCKDTYTYDLSQLLPELAEPKTFGKVTYDTPNLIWSGDAYSDEEITVDESGKVSITVKSTSSVDENAGTLTVNVVTNNYADMTLKLAVKSTNKKIVELQTGSKVLPNGTLTYGQKLSELSFEKAVFVEHGTNTEINGTLQWENQDTMPGTGTTRACWVFTPDDGEQYTEVTGWTSITVEKADPVVSELPAVADRVYDPEKALTDADLTGGTVSVDGRWSFTKTDIIPTVDNAGYEAVFTPADTKNYNTITRTIAVKVTKATPYIVEMPSASAITYGEALDVSKLTGGKATYKDAKGAEISGSFTWKQGSLKPAVSDSGVTEYEVIFTPEDTANYTAVNIKITITVKAASQTPETPGPSASPAPSNTPAPSSTPEPSNTPEPGNTAAPITTQTPEPEKTAKPESISQAQQKKNGLALNSKWKVVQTGKKLKIRWGKVTGATGYRVYVQYANAKFTKKSAIYVNSKKSVLTITKINGKKINGKKNFKVYVEACKMVNGKQVALGKSLDAYVAGSRNTTYTNAKSIKLKKKSYQLNVGKSAAIKAKTVLKDKKKKPLSDAYGKEFRYDTNNSNVATVSSTGKIKAVGKGSCKIYVYARNGYKKTITVTVK